MKKGLIKENKEKVIAAAIALALLTTSAVASIFSSDKTELSDEDISIYNYEIEALINDMENSMDESEFTPENITYVDSEDDKAKDDRFNKYESKIFKYPPMFFYR